MEVILIAWVVIGLLVPGVILFWPHSWTILGPRDQGIRLRFGQKVGGARKAGIVHKMPWDRMGVMDGRQVPYDVVVKKLSTGAPDAMTFGIDLLVVFEPYDPERYLLVAKGKDPITLLEPFVPGAIQKLLNQTSGNAILNGGIRTILAQAREELAAIAEDWGVRITKFELQDLDLPDVIFRTTEIVKEAEAKAEAMRKMSDAEIETTLKQMQAQGKFYLIKEVLDMLRDVAPSGFGHTLSLGGDPSTLASWIGEALDMLERQEAHTKEGGSDVVGV